MGFMVNSSISTAGFTVFYGIHMYTFNSGDILLQKLLLFKNHSHPHGYSEYAFLERGGISISDWRMHDADV